MLETAAAGRMPDARKFGIGDPSAAKTFKAIRERGDDKDIYVASRLPKVKGKAAYPAATLSAVLRDAADALQQAFVRSAMLDAVAPLATSGRRFCHCITLVSWNSSMRKCFSSTPMRS